MTEAEWLSCTSPVAMLDFLQGEFITLVDRVPPGQREAMRRHVLALTQPRKARLFACACVRMIWPMLEDRRSREAVEVAERDLDGLATEEEWEEARAGAIQARVASQIGRRGLLEVLVRGTRLGAIAALSGAIGAMGGNPRDAVSDCTTAAVWAELYATHEDVHRAQAGLIRDIYGNPFRPVEVATAWQTPTVLSLAQAAYDNFNLPIGDVNDRLAILADALEEAGCTSADILNHLRVPGVHVRGCCALDLVLEKQ